jgi:hypothetical protein
MGEQRKVYEVLVGKLEGKRTLRRPRYRRKDGIRMYVGEIGWGWSGFSQGLNTVMNLRVLAPRS